MNILITGGTGFVGKHLTLHLTKLGHNVCILTRKPDKYEGYKNITYLDYDITANNLPKIDAVVNLAGDSLFGRWTEKKKERILQSRIDTTKKVIDLMEQMEHKPKVFISGSAVGYYGTSQTKTFTEESKIPGIDFLANVVEKWENTAKRAESLGIRTIYARFGVILGSEGALPKMSFPVKLFFGGKIGTGEQWMPWVHLVDVIRLITFCLFEEKITGPINVTAPNPERNIDFMKTLAKAIKRPFWFPTPNALVRLATGEMNMLITEGQYVLPKKALDNNFEFTYENLPLALKNIYS